MGEEQSLDGKNENERPGVETFVTATEIPKIIVGDGDEAT